MKKILVIIEASEGSELDRDTVLHKLADVFCEEESIDGIICRDADEYVIYRTDGFKL